MASVQVDRRALAGLIRRVRRVNKGVQADGTFTLRPGELQVDWGNGGEVLDVEGDTEAQCHLADRYMRKLPNVLRGGGAITLEIRDGRVFFDRFSIDAFIERNPEAPMLPTSPRHADFLLLPLRHSQEVIEEAGLTAEVELAHERFVATTKAVARKLRWLGVSEVEVKRFLVERLRSRAEGQEALPFGEPVAVAAATDDQFSLFE
ncbi:MAG: hypothetical protein KC502_10925 [Myxococcales bacterium]|nr:hypothetical protein [Myxococcales bacterium]